MSSSPAVTAPSRPGATARSGSRRWLGTTLISIAVTAVVLFGGYLATVIFGNVMGTEFCPHTFERRSFAFREIPYTGIQISSIDRRSDIGLVEMHIIDKKYIIPDETEPKTWHLISLIRFRGTYATGDASLLMSYLDAEDEKGEHAWLNWSEANPNLAKILWPAVAKAAQDNNYLIVPDLFSHARSASTPAELQKKVDETLAKKP